MTGAFEKQNNGFTIVLHKKANMSKKLLIVESPAKAKTIGKYLGDDFLVSSSYGHIRDLPKKNAIDIENGFATSYEIPADKKKVVAELKKLAKKSDEIYLATDEDREGEAISWHLCEVLNLDVKTAKRVTYTEITKQAIEKALEKPRLVNVDLVNAQQARRVLDRLVGFELSPVLWKKVKPSLSAGRVQSVAVRILVEREKEILAFDPESFFKITGNFLTDNQQGLASEYEQTFTSADEVQEFLELCKKNTFQVANVEKKQGKRSPQAPFTTSTLQQAASQQLGYSVTRTMSVAQRLYENGHITYMRTDSISISQLAIDSAGATIEQQFGAKYSNPRQFASKNKNAQEAHEAIRPTNLAVNAVSGSNEEEKLYQLIWKRTIASQMADASIDRTIIKIEGNDLPKAFTAKGETIAFDGFMRVYEQALTKETVLPTVEAGDALTDDSITGTQKYTKPAPRYTEASLVKKLEELGIGRPSTYAPTINTIQKRTYAVKETREGKERPFEVIQLSKGEIVAETKQEIAGNEKSKLFPTDIGIVVTDFLVDNFPQILDYSFTANIEEQFDAIADGSTPWQNMLKDFYNPFHKNIEDIAENAERANGERVLGNHPESGIIIKTRIGRFGPMVQLGEIDEDQPEKKPKYAKLQPGQTIQTITLEEALDLFKLPRVVGQYEDLDLKAAIGRFGPYIQHGKLFASIPKDLNPYTIGLQEATDLIIEKKKKEAEKYINSFNDGEIEVLNGRWGAYIKKDKKNYKIPKEQKEDAKSLTLEDCLKIISESKK